MYFCHSLKALIRIPIIVSETVILTTLSRLEADFEGLMESWSSVRSDYENERKYLGFDFSPRMRFI